MLLLHLTTYKPEYKAWQKTSDILSVCPSTKLVNQTFEIFVTSLNVAGSTDSNIDLSCSEIGCSGFYRSQCLINQVTELKKLIYLYQEKCSAYYVNCRAVIYIELHRLYLINIYE